MRTRAACCLKMRMTFADDARRPVVPRNPHVQKVREASIASARNASIHSYQFSQQNVKNEKCIQFSETEPKSNNPPKERATEDEGAAPRTRYATIDAHDRSRFRGYAPSSRIARSNLIPPGPASLPRRVDLSID